MSVPGVAQMGNHVGARMKGDSHTSTPSAVKSLHEGRGFKGPEPHTSVAMKAGSQGRHK